MFLGIFGGCPLVLTFPERIFSNMHPPPDTYVFIRIYPAGIFYLIRFVKVQDQVRGD